MLFSWFALRAEIAVLRDEATLAEIQGKTLRQQIEAGHLTPIVGKTYPLPEVPEAIRKEKAGWKKQL